MKRTLLQPVILFLLGLVSGINLLAQDTINDPDFIDINQAEAEIINDVPNQIDKTKNKVNYHMQVGASYFMSSQLSGPGYYFSPSLSYDASKKLNLIVGTGISYQQFQMESTDGSQEIVPVMSYSVFTQGAYKLNDNLIVDGCVSYTRNDVPNLNKDDDSDQNQTFQNDITGCSFGLTYKIRPNLSFGIHFDYSNNPYNFYNQSNYYNNSFNQLFMPNYTSNPFGFGY